MNIVPFDELKFFLGCLCKRGHDYCGTGLTLRYIKSNKRCVECCDEQNRRYQQSEKGKKALKRYRQSDIGQETHRLHQKTEKRKEYMRLYEKSEKRKKTRKRYWQSEEGKATQHRYWHGEKAKKNRQLSNNLRRARLRQNPCVPYNTAQVEALKQKFDNCCAYCGIQSSQLSLDHVVPIALSGADAIYNLVPCCLNCNRSKNDTPVEEWYLSQSFFSQARYDRILCECSLPSEPIANRRRKLSPEQVASIHQLRSVGASYAELAKQFNTSERTIRRVIRKEGYYRH